MAKRAPLLVSVLFLLPALAATVATAADEPGTPCPVGEGAFDCTPIRPGARLSAPYVCSLNFVYGDSEGGRYVGTAGHCTDHVGQRVGARGAPDFGEVVFRNGAGATADFALLRVDEEDRALVSPRACGMGGPIGIAPATLAPGERVHVYGQAVGIGDVPPTRGRDGVLMSWGSTRWTAAIASLPGDSGAPMLLSTGEAAGHLTGISGGFTYSPGRNPTTPMISGPRITVALAAAESATGLDLHLVTAPLSTSEERAADAAAAAFVC